METEINEIYRNLLKNQKKFERSLAPLVFPMLERDKRKKEGFDYSEVSTPASTVIQSSQQHRSRTDGYFSQQRRGEVNSKGNVSQSKQHSDINQQGEDHMRSSSKGQLVLPPLDT